MNPGPVGGFGQDGAGGRDGAGGPDVGDRRNHRHHRHRRISSVGLRQFRDPQKVTLRRHAPINGIKRHGFKGAYCEYFKGALQRDPGAENRDRPRVAFLSSEGAACGYRECADPASGEFPKKWAIQENPRPMGNRPPSRTTGIPACRAVWDSFDPVNCNLFHDVNAGLAGNQKDVGIRYLAQGGRCDT